MGTVYGVNRALLNTQTANTIDPEVQGAKVKWYYDEYEAAALAADSVIELFGKDFPVGARVVDFIVDHDALAAASVWLKLGTKADDDALMALKSSYAADKKNFTDDGVAASLGYEISSGDGQTLVLTSSGASTATGTIKVAVAIAAKG